MDYLYDKVELYDTIKHIMQGHGLTDNIPPIQEGLKDIEHHMLHFLENHDEQRIASPEFASKAKIAKPAMVVSATISTSPTMIYFGQELGEDGSEDAGFGSPSRTSIFDYVGVPAFQRWVNDKKFDGGQSTKEELKLRDFYKRLLNFTISSDALMGEYADIHQYNRQKTLNYNQKVLSFARWSENEKLIVISNFDAIGNHRFVLEIPAEVIKKMKIKDGNYMMLDQLYQQKSFKLTVRDNIGLLTVQLAPLESYILKLQ